MEREKGPEAEALRRSVCVVNKSLHRRPASRPHSKRAGYSCIDIPTSAPLQISGVEGDGRTFRGEGRGHAAETRRTNVETKANRNGAERAKSLH